MQSLHNCSCLVWPFGIEIRITAAQGLLTKPLSYTSFEKKNKNKNHNNGLFFPEYLC